MSNRNNFKLKVSDDRIYTTASVDMKNVEDDESNNKDNAKQ